MCFGFLWSFCSFPVHTLVAAQICGTTPAGVFMVPERRSIYPHILLLCFVMLFQYCVDYSWYSRCCCQQSGHCPTCRSRGQCHQTFNDTLERCERCTETDEECVELNRDAWSCHRRDKCSRFSHAGKWGFNDRSMPLHWCHGRFRVFPPRLGERLRKRERAQTLARLKVVFMEKVLINMIGRLERAKSMLRLTLLILSRH